MSEVIGKIIVVDKHAQNNITLTMGSTDIKMSRQPIWLFKMANYNIITSVSVLQIWTKTCQYEYLVSFVCRRLLIFWEHQFPSVYVKSSQTARNWAFKWWLRSLDTQKNKKNLSRIYINNKMLWYHIQWKKKQ